MVRRRALGAKRRGLARRALGLLTAALLGCSSASPEEVDRPARTHVLDPADDDRCAGAFPPRDALALDGLPGFERLDVRRTVRMVGRHRSRGEARCTGVLIAPDLLLSLASCDFSEGDQLEFGVDAGGTASYVIAVAEVREERLDRDVDLAVVRIARPIGRRVGVPTARARPLVEGEAGLVLGYDRGAGLELEAGTIVLGDGRAYLHVGAQPILAAPGAPLFDARGVLVGLLRRGECRDRTGDAWLEVVPLALAETFSATLRRFAGGETALIADLDGDAHGELVLWRADLEREVGTLTAWSSKGDRVLDGRTLGRAGDRVLAAELDGKPGRELIAWDPISRAIETTLDPSVPAAPLLPPGEPADVLFATDVDLDGRDDLVLWHPERASFSATSLDGTELFSEIAVPSNEDVPWAGDFDGDGRADLATWRPDAGSLIIRDLDGNEPLGRISTLDLGSAEDEIIPARYEGGRVDFATWRPRTGAVTVWLPSARTSSVDDLVNAHEWPLTGDWDGDGRDDMIGWDAAARVLWIERYATRVFYRPISESLAIPGARTSSRAEAALPSSSEAPDARVASGICGQGANWRDVALARETAGLDRAALDGVARAVGMLSWVDDLRDHDDRGALAGRAWCSGVLIAPDLFLTAAHCLSAESASRLGLAFPSEGGLPLASDRAASALVASFGHALGEGGAPGELARHRVVALVEQDATLDYAILVGSSRVDLQACKLEYSIVSPK